MRAKVKIFGNENNCITNIYYKFVMQLKKGIRRLEKVGSVKWYIITLIICCLCELCPQKTYEQTEAVFAKNEIFPRIKKQSIKSLQTRQKSSPTSLSQFLDIRISHLPASGSQSSDIRVSGSFSNCFPQKGLIM